MIRELLLAGAALLSLTGLAAPTAESISGSQISLKEADPKPKDINWNQQQGVFMYGRVSIAEQCKVQPSNLWCISQPLPEKTLGAYDIIQTSLEVKSHFTYVADVVDNWRVHSSAVLMKQDWSGDCDDLTSTTLDVMIRAGQPRNKVWMVLADVMHTNVLDHLIGMVQDSEGHYWIVGDTSGQNVYPANRVKYRIVGVTRADDIMNWQDPHWVDAFPTEALQSNVLLTPALVETKPILKF